MGFWPAVLIWATMIYAQASLQGVNPRAIAALIQIESSGYPYAYNEYSGATGLMGVMPSDSPGLEWLFKGRPTSQELFDPELNIHWGTGIFKWGLDAWGTYEQAAAAYFGAIDSEGNITGDMDVTGTTGNEYVDKFMRLYERR